APPIFPLVIFNSIRESSDSQPSGCRQGLVTTIRLAIASGNRQVGSLLSIVICQQIFGQTHLRSLNPRCPRGTPSLPMKNAKKAVLPIRHGHPCDLSREARLMAPDRE